MALFGESGGVVAEAEFVSIKVAKSRLQWDETRKTLEMALAMRA
ncbi:MAG: hypothetical protein AAFW81_12530 [Pseudomonadota bacterium]